MSEKKELNQEQLEKVTGGSDGGSVYENPADVVFLHNVGEKINLYRKVDQKTVEATITIRGIANVKRLYFACYYCKINDGHGNGWLGDVHGIQFENRVSIPYKTGL